jgi:hypothetical protein
VAVSTRGSGHPEALCETEENEPILVS